MSGLSTESETYYPQAESGGGWRTAVEAGAARDYAGIDLSKLDAARAWNARHSVPSAVAVVRHGYLAAEWYEQGASSATTFNVYSCTKSFTGTAFGLLFDDTRQGKLAGTRTVELDSPAYAFIPEGHPLTDARKGRITLRHLLSMTSGIPGESIGVFDTRTASGVSPFTAALGFAPLTAKTPLGQAWTDRLSSEPGSLWDYSDPAYVHLALAFRNITGEELGPYMQRRVFDPIGIEGLTWEPMGFDDGRVGAHTSPHTRLYISAREMARFGYLMLRGGAWKRNPIVARWWLDLATKPSQTYNPQYGLTWWVNTEETWPGVPRDSFAAMGANCNACYVIPSLDLVVVRIGTGPAGALDTDPGFISSVLGAVIPG